MATATQLRTLYEENLSLRRTLQDQRELNNNLREELDKASQALYEIGENLGMEDGITLETVVAHSALYAVVAGTPQEQECEGEEGYCTTRA